MLEELLIIYLSLGQTEMQIKIYTKQIDFTYKTCNYVKKCKLTGLNLKQHKVEPEKIGWLS